MTKIEGSGSESGSGSISQRHGSADPDPDPPQNVMDPQHWKEQYLLLPNTLLALVSFKTARFTILDSNRDFRNISR
jgi:hypothetical protein